MKFLLGALGLVIVGVGILSVLHFFNPEYQAEKEAKRIAEEIKQQYLNDTYGGDTPEETLQLFIDALKAGDMDLAARYFVLDKQDEQKKYLAQIKNRGLLDLMIKDVKKLGNRYTIRLGDTNEFIFETYNEKKELVMQADLIKGPSGKWKIQDL